ncbi:Alpha amylase, catalytic subdomain [Planoprotostelium fungivorum]|uniref:Alpha amylase, catalytic subdomain n=1 Tax=Planoprotostelium fungivorum TaxID=1890364 RepID=A0A2P6NDS4_9EUKA|nr:Alpha amylase, catalytic subdomain [Planoprotostelium fungivorum]
MVTLAKDALIHRINYFRRTMQNVKPISSIPLSTYRIQFHKDFNIKAALDNDLPNYLKDLGVSYAYSSPLLRARPGSTHGYDVVDHDQLNPEIANDSQFHDFSGKLRGNGLGLLLDIVPNHVGIAHPTSKWWFNVLENGRASPFANHFDINWDAPEHKGRLMVASLGSPIGQVVANGEVKVVFNEENPLASENNDEDPKLGSIQLHYYSNPFAVDPTTLVSVLQKVQNDSIKSIVEALKKLPHRDTIGDLSQEHETARTKRAEEWKGLKKKISEVMKGDEEARAAVEAALKELNDDKERLYAFVQEQPYRLAFWKSANDELNYRRFFDINELMAIKTERPQVFDDSHRLVFQWVKEGRVNALRLDHPDGLFDPVTYTRKLQKEVQKHLPADFKSRDKNPETPFYILIEKILEPGEDLSHDWNVQGTVGYDYMNVLNDVFVDTQNEKAHRELYKKWSRDPEQSFENLLYNCKKLILASSMETELNTLSNVLYKIARSHRSAQDYSSKSIKLALSEFIAHFPVYRTYITTETTKVDETDAKFIQHAVDLVKSKSVQIDSGLAQFISDILFLKGEESVSEEEKKARRYFIMKFQQVTGPVMAKGLEDTSFYRFFLLTSLNEVGGNPDAFGISLEEFHKNNEVRAISWPTAMSGTSTHDTKRSEDVRSRINVLSEIPHLWSSTVQRFAEIGAKHKSHVEGLGQVPERNEEYMIYQTLVGVWPIGLQKGDDELVDRLTNYLMKSIREAKLRTFWTLTNQPYEDAFKSFVDKVTRDEEFLSVFHKFQKKISEVGKLNSLSQQVVKLTAPGVPDVYQGTEVWSLSLVDPDNRRPVDYKASQKILREIQSKVKPGASAQEYEGLIKSLNTDTDNGGIKLFVTQALLNARNEYSDLFLDGDYKAATVSGDRSNHLIAYTRQHNNQRLLVVAARFFSKLLDSQNNLQFENGSDLSGKWEGHSVKGYIEGDYIDILSGASHSASGGSLDLSKVLKLQPFAVLVSSANPTSR